MPPRTLPPSRDPSAALPLALAAAALIVAVTASTSTTSAAAAAQQQEGNKTTKAVEQSLWKNVTAEAANAANEAVSEFDSHHHAQSAISRLHHVEDALIDKIFGFSSSSSSAAAASHGPVARLSNKVAADILSELIRDENRWRRLRNKVEGGSNNSKQGHGGDQTAEYQKYCTSFGSYNIYGTVHWENGKLSPPWQNAMATMSRLALSHDANTTADAEAAAAALPVESNDQVLAHSTFNITIDHAGGGTAYECRNVPYVLLNQFGAGAPQSPQWRVQHAPIRFNLHTIENCLTTPLSSSQMSQLESIKTKMTPGGILVTVDNVDVDATPCA